MRKWMGGETFFGHPWLKYCPERKTTLILHVRERVQMGAGTAWTLREKETSASATGAPASA